MSMQAKKITSLIRNLASADPSKRRSAAEALAGGDERAVYPLIKALRDGNLGVQDAAMRSLISIGGEITAYMVLPLLREDAYLRNTALIILKEIGGAAITLLRLLLKDKDDDIRKFVLDLIFEARQCDYPEEIVRLLDTDPNPNVRASAAKAIAVIDYRKALPSLINALKDDEWVCFSALESLAMMRDESSVAQIAALLENPSDALRYAAIDALGVIGSGLSSRVLLDRLPGMEGFERTEIIRSLVRIGITPSMSEVSGTLIEMFRNGEWDDKLIALKGLTDLKEEVATPVIVDIAGFLDPSEPDSEERLMVIKDTLHSFGCTEMLLSILNDPSIKYRGKSIAIEITGDLRCEKAIPYLIDILNNNAVRDIRRASAESLGKMIDSEQAKEALAHAIGDNDGHVRKVAVEAMGRIGGSSSFETLLDMIRTEKYDDITEEAVKALLLIDPARLYSHVKEFGSSTKEIIGRHTETPEVLMTLLDDSSPDVRISAISGLGRIKGDAAVKRVSGLIRDPEPEIRKAAISAMGDLDCCHDEIKSALNDSDMWVRIYAVNALGMSRRPDMIAAISPMLEDSAAPVVFSAIDAIARIGGEDASGILHHLTNHADEGIRIKACEALDNMNYSETHDLGPDGT